METNTLTNRQVLMQGQGNVAGVEEGLSVFPKANPAWGVVMAEPQSVCMHSRHDMVACRSSSMKGKGETWCSTCLLPSGLPRLQYFPTFDELPLMDEYVDPNYYADVGGGTMLPIKHW